MAIPVLGLLLPAILLSLLISLHESTAQIHSQTSFDNNNIQHHSLLSEFQDANLKISQLESILEESIQDLNAKCFNLSVNEKLLDEMTHEIDGLRSDLSSLKGDSSITVKKLDLLEEEVRLLWDASRKNNFQLHALEVTAQEAEKRLEMVTSRVEKMSDIVSEQWIQIQQLEQAVKIAEMRTVRVKRQIMFTRCTFLKFIKNNFFNHRENLKGMLDSFTSYKGCSYVYKASHYLARPFSAAKHYHHQLQGFIRQEMERNEITAALANEEVVFFMASALITFPILSAWTFLSSRFS